MRTLMVLGMVCVLGSACAHDKAPALDATAPVEAGRLVRQGHAPLGASSHASLVTLELELSNGTKLLSQPSVMTLPDSDAVVRQGFRLGEGEARTDGTLDLTLRPVLTADGRCAVQASSKLSTAATPEAASAKKQVRAPMGKWVDVFDDAPIQVRMRCTQGGVGPSMASAR